MPVVALLGAALVALIASSWLLNRDALRAAVEAQIRAVTGLDLVVNGSIDISVFPGSYVSFHDVGLKGGGTADPALNVDVLTANLRLLPLLLLPLDEQPASAAPAATGTRTQGSQRRWPMSCLVTRSPSGPSRSNRRSSRPRPRAPAGRGR